MPTNDDMSHMTHLRSVALADVAHLEEKERTYRGSWKKRGGVGAFMMLARKWDRLEGMLTPPPGIHHASISDPLKDAVHSFDIFSGIERFPSGDDGTVLAEIRDLRRYLLLVEAEMVARGVVNCGLDLAGNAGSRFSTAKEAQNFMRGEMIPVHAVGDETRPHTKVRTGMSGPELAQTVIDEMTNIMDSAPVPLTDSNKHADRAPPLRDGINSCEYGMLLPHQRERYEWSQERTEWRLKTNA